MATALDRPAYNQSNAPTARQAPGPQPGADGWTPQHQAGYDLAQQHVAQGVLPNPFGDKTNFSDLPSATTAAGGTTPNDGLHSPVSRPGDRPSVTRTGVNTSATAAAATGNVYPSPPPTATAPSAADKYIDATKPLIDQQARKQAGVSQADWDKRPGGIGDPFTNGFFKPAGSGVPAIGGAGALPRSPTAPVGGTQAVLPPGGTRVGQNGASVSGVDSVGRKSNMLTSPYGGGTATFDSTPGTRQPFIAGANGANVVRDFVAGGKFSSAKSGTDKSLDQPYVAGLPRGRNQVAVTQNSRDFFRR